MTEREMWVNAINAVAEQEDWIEDHGGDIAGYVARYGSIIDKQHHGNGGEAIYAADMVRLSTLVIRANKLLQAWQTSTAATGGAHPSRATEGGTNEG